MTPVRLGIVGTGARTQTFLRIARRIPDHVEISGVVSRSPARASGLGVPAYGSLEDLVSADRPDAVVASVPWAATPDVIREAVRLGVHVLAETPPAPTVEELRELWRDVAGSPLVQIAEQYLLMPAHAARLALVRAGLVGDVSSVQVSSSHGYHVTSMIRHLLGVGFSPTTVTAHAFRTPLANPLGPDGWTDDPAPVPFTTTLAVLDFGDGRMGLYDFTETQWWNPLRSRRIVVRGTLGEIVDDAVVRLVDATTVLESTITRRTTGRDMDLQGFDLDHVSHEGTVLWRNPWYGARLSEDELAIAEILTREGAYARGEGSAPYPLADACQDHLLALAIEQSAASGAPVTVAAESWASSRAASGPAERGPGRGLDTEWRRR